MSGSVPKTHALHAQIADKSSVKAQASRKVKKRSANKLLKPPAGSAAGHTYDYFKDRWDKFDVDAALAEADEDTDCESDGEGQAQAQSTQVHDRASALSVCVAQSSAGSVLVSFNAPLVLS